MLYAAFMESIYKKVRDGDWYLAAPDIQPYVEWAQTPNGLVMVYKDVEDGGVDERTPVVLSMVGQVAVDRFQFGTTAAYSSAFHLTPEQFRKYGKPFLILEKPVGSIPGLETLEEDWERAKATVADIIETVPKMGSGEVTGLFNEKDTSELAIRVQYELFRVSRTITVL
jgi:hypothetical protein